MTNSNISIKEQLLELVNKPCWFKNGILEIRKNSDAYLSEVGSDYIVIHNKIFEKTHKIHLTNISSIERKDLTEKIKLTWEDDLYEEKLIKVGQLGKEKKYTEAIVEAQSLLELCDPDDNVSVLWATGPIILGLISIANANNKDPEPGTTAYNNLHKYLKILLTAYNNSSEEVQEQYRQSDVNFKIYDKLFGLLEKNLPLSEPVNQNQKKSGCFIATAVYGSPIAKEVILLKNFRDEWLLNFTLGKMLVKFYYFISPSIANQISKNNWLKSVTKTLFIIPIIRLISKLNIKENQNVNN